MDLFNPQWWRGLSVGLLMAFLMDLFNLRWRWGVSMGLLIAAVAYWVCAPREKRIVGGVRRVRSSLADKSTYYLTKAEEAPNKSTAVVDLYGHPSRHHLSRRRTSCA